MIEFDKNDVFDYAYEKVLENIPGPKHKKSGNRINFKCPICGDSSKKPDTKLRGWLNRDPFPYFNCFNWCGKISIYEFLSEITGEEIHDIKRDILREYNYRAEQVFDINRERKRTETDKGDEKSNEQDKAERKSEKEVDYLAEIPADWKDLNVCSDAEKIVRERRIFEAPNIPRGFDLYYSRRMERIVVPWVFMGRIYTWQFRYIYENQEPPYIFPTGRKEPVFGLDNVNEEFPYLFIGEAVFDMIWVENGCCTGINVSDTQRKMLDRFSMYSHVWLLDNQWKDRTSYNKSLKLAEKGENVFVWPRKMESKDINEYIVNNNDNLFFDRDFLVENTYRGLKADLKLRFEK